MLCTCIRDSVRLILEASEGTLEGKVANNIYYIYKYIVTTYSRYRLPREINPYALNIQIPESIIQVERHTGHDNSNRTTFLDTHHY